MKDEPFILELVDEPEEPKNNTTIVNDTPWEE